MAAPAPIRIVHVLGRMDHGGIEHWLLEVFARFDRSRFRHEVVVREPGRHALHDRLDQLGVPCTHCPGHPNPAAFGRAFLALLRQGPAAAVVHSHLDRFTGLVMLFARLGGVPVRIAHMHNDYAGDDRAAGWRRRAYMAAVRGLVRRCATAGIGVGDGAADYLFGPRWRQDPRWRVMPCGIDPAPLSRRAADPGLRSALGLAEGAWVVGSVGRLAEQKNQMVLVEGLPALLRLVPQAVLAIAGTGPLEAQLRTRAAQLGVAPALRLLGPRDDVPHLLTGVFDAFAFPSRFEGLGVAAIEAQAAGLPCILSSAVPAAAWVPAAAAIGLDPDAGAQAWADGIASLRGRTVDHQAAWTAVADGPLAIGHGVAELERLYAGG
jgi:glycosyltransferase involved in cell wall biosynthesis